MEALEMISFSAVRAMTLCLGATATTRFWGGSGVDTLTGGLGSDTFTGTTAGA